MERRNFVMSVLAAGGVAVPALAQEHAGGHQQRTEKLNESQANAVVSFGAWRTHPPLDRFLAPSPPPANVHDVLPFRARIKAGGAVNFIISGFHILGIYGPGTRLSDVNGTLTAPIPGAPPNFPLVVTDARDRVYRGVNPFDLAQGRFGPPLDRVEAVNFDQPGRYLVVCLFVPHFAEGMHGYIHVAP